MRRLYLQFALCLLLQALAVQAQQPSDFEDFIAGRGLAAPANDLSEETDIDIPEPGIAFVNLMGFNNMPVSKYTTTHGWMEVYDDHGNYFRKRVNLSAQGGYTLNYPKRNFVCHFTDEAWNEDNTPDFKIGDWVKQDAFHFKAFYTEFTRGIGEIGYKLFAQMVADRQSYWERLGYDDDSRARCFPDGFPCAVFLNGKFYGIYAWQLKKHRKNMNQKKDEAGHIHLDGNLRDDYIFRGNIKWGQFEVRNPKNLYAYNGWPYDGNSPTMLMDENSSDYDRPTDSEEVRANKQRTAAVKRSIVNMSRYWDELNNIETMGASAEEMRSEIEKRFDVEGMIDYYVFYYFTQNGDATLKNWQWFTYDGVKWTVTPYDLDQTFGMGLYGNIRPHFIPIAELTSGPFYWVYRYYQDDVRVRYAKMRNDGILEYDNVVSIINDWRERIGEELYAMEQQRWPESPCYQESICNDGWEEVPWSEWMDHWYDTSYDNSRTYQPGDCCWLEGKVWRATKTVRGVKPFIRNANIDTMERLTGWVEGRLDYLDDFFNYTTGITETKTADNGGERTVIGIYTLTGVRVQTPSPGKVYVFKYSDGTARKILAR